MKEKPLFSFGDQVEVAVGGQYLRGRVVELIDRGETTKYRVNVANRGDSFVFYGTELRKP